MGAEMQHQHTALIVEDEAMIRELIVECLQDEGFAVREAVDGAQAIELIDQHHEDYCVVLLDLMLPKVSGVDVLRHLEQVDSAVPVVAMSASREHLAEAVRAGATMAVPKPFDIVDLLAVMTRHCPRTGTEQTEAGR
jgi:two-component system response regulator (stage 0 sporulation protein F)